MKRTIRLTETQLRGMIQEAVRQSLSEMGTPRQNELLYKLTGSHEYDNLPVKDASKKIDSLLKSRPKQPMTEKQIAFLQKLRNNGWLVHNSSMVYSDLAFIDWVLQNTNKIDMKLGSKVIEYAKDEIYFMSHINSFSFESCEELQQSKEKTIAEVEAAIGEPFQYDREVYNPNMSLK